MKAQVKKASWGTGLKTVYAVWLVEGNQSFQLARRGTQEECEWFAKMFRIALAKTTLAAKAAEAKVWHRHMAKLDPHPTDEPEWCCRRARLLKQAAQYRRTIDK